MITDYNVENDNIQKREAWGTLLIMVSNVKLSNSEILADSVTKLNHVPPNKRIPFIELL